MPCYTFTLRFWNEKRIWSSILISNLVKCIVTNFKEPFKLQTSIKVSLCTAHQCPVAPSLGRHSAPRRQRRKHHKLALRKPLNFNQSFFFPLLLPVYWSSVHFKLRPHVLTADQCLAAPALCRNPAPRRQRRKHHHRPPLPHQGTYASKWSTIVKFLLILGSHKLYKFCNVFLLCIFICRISFN